MTTETLLERVIARSGLDRRGGHPLWRWRVTDAELEALRDALRRDLRGDGARSVVSAAFCLFAAHHFCRTHDGGAWAWETITAPLGVQPPAGRLHGMVRDGLAWWGRRVLRFGASNEYLLTLVCEGGLPLRVVSDRAHEGRVKRWFREVLRVVETYELPADRVAAQLQELLPPSLRNELVITTGAALLDAVVGLRRVAGAASDPIARLDQVRSGWREALPLELDQQSAVEFLRGLLREPAPCLGDAEGGAHIACFLTLEDGARLERALVLPRELSGAALAGWVGEEPPVRVAFHLLTEDGARRQVALATRLAGESAGWRVERVPGAAAVDGWPAAGGAVRVAVTSGPRELALLALPGAEPLPLALPWAFEDRGGRGRLLAVGRARSAAASVLVALPDAGRYEVESGDAAPIGVLSGAGRALVRLRGRLAWASEDARCSLRSAATELDAPRYVLTGPVMRVGLGGQEVYRGHPTLRVRAGLVERVVPPAALRWRAASGGAWRPWERPPHGDIAVRVVEDGEACFETRLTVVPADFVLRTRAVGATGSFELESRALEAAAVVAPDGAPLAQARRGPAGVMVCDGILANPLETPRVTLRLRFQDGGETALALAPPRPFVGFVGWDGRAVEGQVSLADLPSLRARAIDGTAGAGFLLEGTRKGSGVVAIAGLVPLGEGAFELPLDVVREALEALHLGDGIDDVVRLWVTALGRPARGHRRELAVVAREQALRPDRKDGGARDVILDPAAVARGTDPATLRVVARPIEDFFADPPRTPALDLPPVEPGRWRLDPGERPYDAWLVLAWQGGLCRFRPLLVTTKNAAAPTDSPLILATRVRNPDEREAAVLRVLRACAVDRGHPDWPRLRAALRTLATLPPATFDVVRLLPRVPEAVVGALLQLRATDQPLVWGALERLDHLWALVPVAAWARAARTLLAWARGQRALLELEETTAEAYVARRIESLLAALRRDAPFVSVLCEVLGRVVPGLACASPQVEQARSTGGRAAIIAVREAARNALRIRHAADDAWPQADVAALARGDAALARAFADVRGAGDRDFDAVFDAPTLAAAASVTGAPLSLAARVELRRLRAFDREWFDEAHAAQLALLLASRMDVLVREASK